MGARDDISRDDLKRMIAEVAEQSKETDRRIDQRLKQLERQLGRLGNRLGLFVQDMVMPAVDWLFQEQGLPVRRIYPNAVSRDDSGQAVMEIDLLVITCEHALVLKGRSRLSSDDVDEHIERLKRFRDCFTEHADKVLHGAVAAMGAPEEVVRHAERQGLYVLVQAGDDVVLRNQPGFVPKAW